MRDKAIRAAGTLFKVREEDAHLYGHDAPLMERVWKPLTGQVCVDIGFGPGTWTLAALARGAWAFAFDPRIEAVELLMRQIVLNMFTRGIVVPAALLDVETTREFSDSSFHWGEKDKVVPTLTLDGFFSQVKPPSVDYINVDAEGAEREVLKGARRTLIMHKPKLVIEVHRNVNATDLVADLYELGQGYVCLVRDGFLLAEVPR